MLYIQWQAGGTTCCIGPFWSVYPDGSGEAIGQDWQAYKIQTENYNFKRVIVPTKYHFIYFK